MCLWPCAVRVADAHRVDQRDDGRGRAFDGFGVGVDAQALVDGFACQSGLFPSLSRGGLRWGLFVHGPPFWQYPASSATAGDQADLDLIVFDPVA